MITLTPDTCNRGTMHLGMHPIYTMIEDKSYRTSKCEKALHAYINKSWRCHCRILVSHPYITIILCSIPDNFIHAFKCPMSPRPFITDLSPWSVRPSLITEPMTTLVGNCLKCCRLYYGLVAMGCCLIFLYCVLSCLISCLASTVSTYIRALRDFN